MKYAFPTNYGDDCVIVAIDKSLIPMIAGALRPFEQRGYWLNDIDYERGYNAIAEIQANMANNCLAKLIESNDRIYRLLDTALNGVVYTASGSTPPEISPAIPAAPSAELGAAPGLRRQLLDSQGVIPGGWLGFGAAPATTADLVAAMKAGSQSEIDRVKASINGLQTLAQGATVFSVVEDFLSDSVAATAEGGILATLVVSTMAQAAFAGAQAGQLDSLIAALQRVVASLDGGADPRPESNILAELETANQALV